jgi:peptidylprolyl isomerase
VLNRRLLPVAVACLFALTACGSPSSSPSPSGTLTPAATASASPSASVTVQTSLDGITVTGKQLKAPKVTFKSPFAIDKTRSRVLIPGKGNTVLATGLVTVHYYGVNGRTGKVFDQSYSRKATATFPLDQVITGFRLGLTGQKVGSRVLIAMPGTDGYDANGGSSDGSIAVGDTLIFVVDIVGASVAQPSGKTVTPAAGLPTVTGDAASKPTVTIPKATAPTSMSAQVLIQGSGAKVAKGQTIYARYVGYSWKTGKLIDDQFTTPSEGTLASTIPGWQSGLVGKSVGSRVLLVLPPKYGYPQGSNNPPLEAGDTIVYVIDILYTYKA